MIATGVLEVVSSIRICVMGRWRHRQPLAYPSIQKFCKAWADLVATPQEADILLFAHPDDLARELPEIVQNREARRGKVVLLSEEPFWDSVWGSDRYAREQTLRAQDEEISFINLNHWTSDIFRFFQIPYFLLTDYRYFPRYAVRFKRNANKGRKFWRQHFKSTPVQSAFIAEHRSNVKFDVRGANNELTGLAAYRTRVAEMVTGDAVVRQGRGWGETGFRRQHLIDWHLDKLLRFDRKCKIMSAIENTHQINYISEKFFDSMAVGSVPLYYASPDHRIHQLANSHLWVNLWQLEESAAAAKISDFEPDDTFLDAYAAGQRAMAKLFETARPFAREYTRLAAMLHSELATILDRPGPNVSVTR